MKYFVFVFYFFVPSVFSQIPTTDIAGFTQRQLEYIETLQAGLDRARSLENQIRQIQNSDDLLAAFKGARELALLFNTSEFKELRTVIPKNPLDIIDSLSSGDISDSLTDLYSDILDDLIDVYSVVDVNFDDGVDVEDLKVKKKEISDRQIAVKANYLASSYSAVESSSGNILIAEELINKIEETEDLKASIDLNSRINAEILIQLNQAIKLIGIYGLSDAESQMAIEQNKLNAKKRFGIN